MTNKLETYSDIIYLTSFRNPNYEEIHFDKFLERIFPSKETFLANFDLTKIRQQLADKYGNSTTCFKDNGKLVDIEFQNLKYYQKGVGLIGPKYNQLDEPVHILSIDNYEMLYNGYHRTLYHMLNNVWTLKAYRLELDSKHST